MKSFKEMKSQIDEKLGKNTPLSSWISDFVNSKDPRFNGKSKEERINMAKGAYYKAQNEATIPLSDKEKNKMLSKKDKNTLAKIADLMSKQKKPTKEGYYKNIDTNRKEDERLAKQKKEKENKKPKDWAHALAAESASSKLLNKLKDIEHKKNWAKNIKVPDYSQTPKKEPIDLSKPIKEALGDHAGLTKAANNEKHGPDAKDFHTAAKHIKYGNVAALKKHLRSMDTDPRDHVLTKFVDKKHHKALGFQMNEASSHVYVSDTNAKKVLGKHDSLFKAKAHMDSLYKKNPKGKYAMHTGNLSNTLGIKEGNNDKVDVNHAANAVAKTFKGNVQTASRFLSHLKPGTKKTTTWGDVNKALVKQGVQTHHIAKVAGHLKDKFQKEDVEQIDELSKKTLGSYVKKASFNAAQAAYQAGGSGGNIPRLQPHMDKLNKRTAGVNKATDKLTKEENLDEISKKGRHYYEATDPAKAQKEVEKAQMAAKHASERESLAKKQQREKDSMKEETTMLSFEDFLKEADMKNAVKYAVGLAKKHAGNMTHAVKTIEKKRKGLSNHPDVVNALRTANEEYYCEELDWSYEDFLKEWNQLDELSKGTLKNYLKKKIGTVPHDADDDSLTAKLDARDNFSDANRKYSYHAGGGHGTKTPSRAEIQKGIKKDNKNINRALHKLAKEEVEFFQLNELSKGKLVKYVKKAANTLHKNMQPLDGPHGDPEDLEPSDKYFDRLGHINKAINKIGKKSKKTEGWDKKKTETVKHPNQKVLDVDGDGKIEKDDFEKLRKGRHGKKDESHCNEGANTKMKGDDPCWDSHEMVGMKMKNGKKVPNCVPKKEGVGDWINNKLNQLGDKITQHTMKQAAKNPAELKRLKQGMALAALEKEEVESSDDIIFEKKSYKAFTSEMDNSRRYVHKGTRYGGAAQHDDDNEFDNDDYGDKEKYKQKLFGKPAKKEPAVKPVKRGRGRPMGSKSGARN